MELLPILHLEQIWWEEVKCCKPKRDPCGISLITFSYPKTNPLITLCEISFPLQNMWTSLCLCTIKPRWFLRGLLFQFDLIDLKSYLYLNGCSSVCGEAFSKCNHNNNMVQTVQNKLEPKREFAIKKCIS